MTSLLTINKYSLYNLYLLSSVRIVLLSVSFGFIFQISVSYGQTFPGTGGLLFPPSGTVGITQSTANVNGIGTLGGCKIIESVTIDLDHTWTGDIALILIAPNGTFIELSSGNGGSGNDFKNTVFTDSAPINIVSGSPPYTGSFKPEGRQNTSINNPYSNANAPGTYTFANTFTGINADGVWTLYLNDYVALDVGFLNSWSITFSNNGNNFTVDTGPDISVCSGNNVTVTASNTAPNPINYAWSNGGSGPSVTISAISSPLTLTVTVTDQSGCTATDTKNISITNPPTGTPVTLQQCMSVPPNQATFNLSASNATVGSGFTVNWFNDAGLLTPILNPAAFVSTSATIYAVVSNGSCSSAPVPVQLEVTSLPTNGFGIEWAQTEICQPQMVGLNFTLPSPGTYTYQYSLACTAGTETNSITTSNNPVFFNVSGNCTISISQIIQVATGCSIVFDPPLTDDISLEPAPTIMVSGMQICSGQSLNLADFVTASAGATLTFHSASPPLPSNQLGSTTVNPAGTTTYYALATSPSGCSSQETLVVTVVTSNTPFSTDISWCENAPSIPLSAYVVPSNLTGIWSGSGVSGNNFNPAGLSGTVVLTFNPENDCYLDGTLTVQLIPQQIPDLSTAEVCAGSDPLDLTILQDPGYPSGIWSGNGVTGSVFTPGSLTGTINIIFTSDGQCVSPATTTIEIFPLPDLNITQNNAVCQGETINLNDYVIGPSGNVITFHSGLPATSGNQIFDPNITINNPVTYFVKATDSHGCYYVQPLVINITPGINPVQGNIEVCENAGNILLTQYLTPANLSGIWSGPGVTGNIFNPTGLQGNIFITFVPDDVCYTGGMVQAVITPLATPVLLTASICGDGDPINLSSLQDPSFQNGEWTGSGVSNNFFDPANLNGSIQIIFTPSEPCTSPGTTTIEIFDLPVIGVIQNVVVCAGETVDLSSYVSNSTGFDIHYYSSLPTVPINEVNNTVVTISNTADFFITATDANGCSSTFTLTINAAQGESPVNSSVSICGLETNVDLSVYLNPPGLPGIWSGQGVNGNNFNPTGLQGNVLLHFDPDNLCYADGQLNIQILAPQMIVLGSADICSDSDAYNLDVLLDPSFPDGTWTGAGVSGYFFNPGALSGEIPLTFTPVSGCAAPGSTVIRIVPQPYVDILSEITVCQGSSVILSDYVLNTYGNSISFHTSLPATLSNEVNNPNIVVTGTVQYFVKSTNQNGCFYVQPLTIFATPGGNTVPGVAVVCKNEGMYNLNILNDPLAGAGVWSGNGVINNQLNLTSISGIVSVTFTPDNLCYTQATTYVEIRNPVQLNLGAANVCSTSGNFNLSTIADPLFPVGNWSGAGVSNGLFDPALLSGPVSIQFNPTGFCLDNAVTTINVTVSQTPSLKKTSICESIDTLMLSTLRDPLFKMGTWSGTGVRDSFFISSGLQGTNSVTFTSSQACVLPASTTIEITPFKSPVLLPLEICQESGPVDLKTLQDTLFSKGVWSGTGVQNNFFDPISLSGSIMATFVAETPCTLPASTTITVNESPVISDFKISCDPTSQYYDVRFVLSLGDSSTYMVNGMPTDKAYISDNISSGVPYYFVISDGNQCKSTILEGNKNCACVTNSGTMDFTNTPLKVCQSEMAIAVHAGDQSLDPNDGFIFVLHDKSGLQLGNILAISNVPHFSFPDHGMLDKTYYISAIAGDTLTNGMVDQNNGCFSIAAGIPVVFYAPDLKVDQIADICVDNCTEINMYFKGIPPFRLEFEMLSNQAIVIKDTIISLSNAYVYSICPVSLQLKEGNTRFNITHFSDARCSPENIDSLLIFNVGKKRNYEIKEVLCSGGSMIINGSVYDKNNPSGTEIIYSTMSGQCDSIISVDLSFYPPSNYNITKSICENQTLTVNGNVYDKNKLSGVETIQNGNIYGCDSIITIQLTLVNEIVTLLNQTLCTGESIMVNGKIYNENNPSGAELFAGNGADKCDSTVVIALTFKDKKIHTLDQTLCADQSITVQGEIYNIQRSEGEVILKNGAQNGCDSIIRIKLSFYPVQTDTIIKYLKKGESILINGVLFSETNNKGLTVRNEHTIHGCKQYDYIIVYFEQDFISATIETIAESCPGMNDGKIWITGITGCSDYTLKVNGKLYSFTTLPFAVDHLSPGIYLIEISGNKDCLLSKSVSVLPSSGIGFTVRPTDFKMLLGDDIKLHPEIIPAPFNAMWEPAQFVTCADCLSPMTRDITGDVNFILTLSDSEGCIFHYNIRLYTSKKETDISFPNIFSPNDDGFNDFFEVKSTPSQQISRLTIYDRWGSQLFDDIKKPDQESIIWDGKSHLKTIQPGVYIYLAEIIDASGNKKHVSGDLTVSF